jgi:hypothetical protein
VTLLLRAVTTYERLPPSFKEEAIPLRMIGLVALNELDDELARYHATRLLADENTDPMSGEPALTAVKVLAAQEAALPLYYYASQPPAGQSPEILSECLRSLLHIPTALVPGLVERHGASPSDLVLAGLFDLLLSHENGPLGRDYLLDFLRATGRHAAYHYLVALIVAQAKATLLPDLLDLARYEQKQARIEILVEALSVLDHDPAVADLLEKLRKRL